MKLQIINGIPVELADITNGTSSNFYEGYAFDEHANVWSNKSGSWKKLAMSRDGGTTFNCCGSRYYTNAKEINKLFKASWKPMINIPVNNGLIDNCPSETEIEQKFIIGTVNGANMSISQTPVVHLSELSARQEAERLAKANPGKRFVLMELKGICFVNNVAWN